MVKHVILWTLKDELNEEEKKERAQKIKAGLEGLKGVVPGLIDIKVETSRFLHCRSDAGQPV